MVDLPTTSIVVSHNSTGVIDPVGERLGSARDFEQSEGRTGHQECMLVRIYHAQPHDLSGVVDTQRFGEKGPRDIDRGVARPRPSGIRESPRHR